MTDHDGKLGLALSGGGFRAAFFHVGVLAQLAERGLLRRVEVISTVSGGSIIGALYYLYLKRLLEQRSDEQLSDQDYLDLVHDMSGFFFRQVEMNFRLRTFTNVWCNLKMQAENYSRSDRMGELFDQYLFRPVVADDSDRPIRMRDLRIQPPDGPAGFSPRAHNAGRRHKVPVLLLNATTLNTGHNWRFEAASMGEPPRATSHAQIDKNMRLLRPQAYEELCEVSGQRNFPLGKAVAASAGVPGIFPPMAVSRMYDDVRVQLVDGGVHDNQGIKGLRDKGCTHFIVSDASGPLTDARDPGTSLLSTLPRSSAITMDRVREEVLDRLMEEQPERVCFLDLRTGLKARRFDFIGCGDPVAPDSAGGDAAESPVNAQVQAALSRIRTDLDAFSEIEAQSLELDGYLLCAAQLDQQAQDVAALGCPTDKSADWPFLQLAGHLTAASPDPLYLKHLRVGEKLLFKAVWLRGWLFGVTLAAVVSLILVGMYAMPERIDVSVTRMQVLALLLTLLAGVLLSPVRQVRRWGRRSRYVLLQALLPALAAGLVRAHLHTYDALFRRWGRVSRLTQTGRRS